ncbi:MAG TPA: glycosyltransferase family 39 protein, partial [Bryobacteraceae bacterium]
LAPLRPLWLDELLQLSETYAHTLRQTLVLAAHNGGGVPVAYLAENLIVNHLGRPLVTAHLFSIACAVAGMAGLILLARLLGAGSGWFSTGVLFALLPLSLRYATEARPYGPALAFGTLATLLVASLEKRPALWKAVLYAAILSLGIYTQPYVAFVGAAHVAWAVSERRRTSAPYIVGGAAAAAVSFLPWYLYARTLWTSAVAAGDFRSSLSAKTPLMILHELSGGGYILTILLLALAAFGYRRTSMPLFCKRLLLFWATVPVPLALAATAAFGYFFAIRQLIFVLPPLCILAAEGLNALPQRSRWLPVGLGLFAAISLFADVHLFTHYRENWGAAAALAKRLLHPRECLVSVPASASRLYFLYQPSLSRRLCNANDQRTHVVLISPYATQKERHSALHRQHWSIARRFETGGSIVVVATPQPLVE